MSVLSVHDEVPIRIEPVVMKATSGRGCSATVLLAEHRSLRLLGLALGRVQETPRPHVFGSEDRESDEDQEPPRSGKHQECDPDEEHGEARDGHSDALATALDEVRNRLDRYECRVVVPAASSFGLDDLELGDGLGCVRLFGVVTPYVPTADVLVHRSSLSRLGRIQEPVSPRLTCAFVRLVTLSTPRTLPVDNRRA